jgi:TfoX/Sxy family transcriptional regulator of competence genes
VKAWKKTSPELVATFDKALPTSPSVTRRPMFGYASAFVNGNMFAGTFQDTIVVRLTDTDRAALLKQKGAAPFEPMGHPMKEYVVVPAGIVAKPKELGAWIERGHRYAMTLPPKGRTKKTPAKKPAATRQTTATKSAVTKRPAARKTGRRTS